MTGNPPDVRSEGQRVHDLGSAVQDQGDSCTVFVVLQDRLDRLALAGPM